MPPTVGTKPLKLRFTPCKSRLQTSCARGPDVSQFLRGTLGKQGIGWRTFSVGYNSIRLDEYSKISYIFLDTRFELELENLEFSNLFIFVNQFLF